MRRKKISPIFGEILNIFGSSFELTKSVLRCKMKMEWNGLVLRIDSFTLLTTDQKFRKNNLS